MAASHLSKTLYSFIESWGGQAEGNRVEQWFKEIKNKGHTTYLNIADPTEISKEAGKTPSSSHKLDVTR